MLQNIKKRNEGFTIIEVLIVLAIAGLILLIVFLAVPALQRNARNTTRKSDISKLLGAMSEFLDNNAGQLPGNCSGTTTVAFQISSTTTGAQSDANVGYYNKGCVTTAPANGNVELLTSTTTQAALNAATTDYVVVVPGGACTAAGGSTAGTSRQVAAVYEIETSGGYTAQCQSS